MYSRLIAAKKARDDACVLVNTLSTAIVTEAEQESKSIVQEMVSPLNAWIYKETGHVNFLQGVAVRESYTDDILDLFFKWDIYWINQERSSIRVYARIYDKEPVMRAYFDDNGGLTMRNFHLPDYLSSHQFAQFVAAFTEITKILNHNVFEKFTIFARELLVKYIDEHTHHTKRSVRLILHAHSESAFASLPLDIVHHICKFALQ